MQKRRERIEKWRHDRKMQEIAQAKSDLGSMVCSIISFISWKKYFQLNIVVMKSLKIKFPYSFPF